MSCEWYMICDLGHQCPCLNHKGHENDSRYKDLDCNNSLYVANIEHGVCGTPCHGHEALWYKDPDGKFII